MEYEMHLYRSVIVFFAAGLCLGLVCGGCEKKTTSQVIREGNLYATHRDEKPGYVILKILKVDEHGYHVRIYSNVFPQIPQSVSPEELVIAGRDQVNENLDLGLGHIPIGKQTFRRWDLMFIQNVPVEESELEGYNTWKEAGGGYF